MVFQRFDLWKTLQNWQKYDLENERPPKSQKVAFFNDVGLRFGREIHKKMLKIDSENRVEKKGKKSRKSDQKAPQTEQGQLSDGLRVPPSSPSIRRKRRILSRGRKI